MRNFFDLPREIATPGKVVRAFRTNFEITLRELQYITGISYTNLSAIEHDRIDIGVRRAVLIAAAFGILPESILFPEGFERPEHKEVERVRVRAKRLFEKKQRAASRNARREVAAGRGRSLDVTAKEMGLRSSRR